MPPEVRELETVVNAIELWKAIHGGCWPGPPLDRELSAIVNEVISGLALLNLSNGFQEERVATQARSLAQQSLRVSLGALQNQVAV
ncbi:MAG TPA: hypothetical protein VN999_18740 [Thermoanaerobaculia bacterium]|nr:hypothetical protein [Thermoanaerobaculia bacterium]